MPLELRFATGNTAKLAQLIDLAGRLGYALAVSSARAGYGDSARYEEIGASCEQIARNGALSVAARIGQPVIAEDSGFFVDALDGEPGIYAGRYLGQQGRAGILQALSGRHDRSAHVISALAWADPRGRCTGWVTRVEGRVALTETWTPGLPDWIAPTPSNPQGGGYNAIFIPAGQSRTLAQIPPDEALLLGYREPNFAALLRWLQAGASG